MTDNRMHTIKQLFLEAQRLREAAPGDIPTTPEYVVTRIFGEGSDEPLYESSKGSFFSLHGTPLLMCFYEQDVPDLKHPDYPRDPENPGAPEYPGLLILFNTVLTNANMKFSQEKDADCSGWLGHGHWYVDYALGHVDPDDLYEGTGSAKFTHKEQKNTLELQARFDIQATRKKKKFSVEIDAKGPFFEDS